MNQQEKKYFEILTERRTELAKALEDPALRGVRRSVVEKYTDQAHFIYELLQNADDANATKARFILENDKLVFAHNGTKHFSITDPMTEDEDSKNKLLGDINSITSIANSSKTGASIGKFGVGFKAVFQYTSTPRIYDSEYRFKIDRFIVPVELEEDYPGRHDDETLFVFPFDHAERTATEAYFDISTKLKNLSYPLLFLSNLRNIEYEFANVFGLYDKNIHETKHFDNTKAEYLVLNQYVGDKISEERLWLFSRVLDRGKDYKGNERYLTYSVGFFLDEKGKLIPVTKPAFCYFPTKEVTNLNFILHAPFLLNESREGIRAGVDHNDKMINLLADLAADSMEYLRDIGANNSFQLIDDGILDIIPFQESAFSPVYDRSKVSFMPFFNRIRRKFQLSEILPARGGYTSRIKAYWADTEDIPELISDKQLSDLLQTQSSFVFVSKGRNSTLHNAASGLGNYIDSIVFDKFVEDDIYRRLTPEFIEQQSESWLISFYSYIVNGRNSLTRIKKIRQLPIFLDAKRKAVAAYDKNDHEVLFLPDEDSTGYNIINEQLYKDEIVKKLLKELEIKKPALEHRIFNKILPQYEEGTRFRGRALSDFKLFLKYYSECENDDEFISALKNLKFIQAVSNDGKSKVIASADRLYMPAEDLKRYFANMNDVLFVDMELYNEQITGRDRHFLEDFLRKIGVSSNVRIYTEEFTYKDYDTVKRLFGNEWPSYTISKYHLRRWIDYRLDGGETVLKHIVEKQSQELSVILWNQLTALYGKKKRILWGNVTVLGGVHKYPYYGENTRPFEGQDAPLFRRTAWLLNKQGEFVAPKDVSVWELSFIYDTQSDGAQNLIKYLQFVIKDDSHLTDEQKRKIARADITEGIPEDELRAFAEKYKREQEAQKNTGEQAPPKIEEQDHFPETIESTEENDSKGNDSGFLEDLYDSEDTKDSETEKVKLDKTTTKVVKDIVKRTKDNLSTPNSSDRPEKDDDVDVDQDEYTPAPIDYSKRIEKAKQKSAAEIEKIVYIEELQARAVVAPKYSYGWFKALLELESLNSGEANANSKEVSITFAKVEREPGTKRTLVLKHPDRYIPQFMEDLADIPLVLHMGDQTKTVAIEVANIKSYTLRVKMKNGADIDGIDLSSVTSAAIDAKSPAFLIEELRKQFNELGKERGYENDYDMQGNLNENIEFVFGPPGTGKTTHLAQNVLIPMMQNNADCKVLVLTPTNKSADVLVRRIMEVASDTSYNRWLVRFGATGDEEIEESPVFRDKTFDIRTLRRNVTVTTIARFPYDFFMPQGARIFLHGINWDYIVIDEASMIPIANIVFPLYKKTPRKFIIAGDPFQIEPITSVDLWKNENIYTMVHLDSFTNQNTVPYQYKVELLTTQYRSIPNIGYVFSNFLYGGILQHYRSADSQRPLNVGNDLGVETLNIIKFPVSKYESIYRCKRLQHSSSYQVYSALFTFEYVCYLSKAIASNNPGSLFKIGVIAPYRAQADMIDKLVASEKLPKEIDVQVGTIHGFQGDECDIIFAVFNTPPTISASKDMFLNKRNIINVSISRARDYLFIVMPDDNTENIDNLRLVKRVEQLVHDTDAWNEFLSPDLEDLMFGDPKYLENNAFSTSHQSVNVYGLPEKCYEVRTEDTAVDVQIHKGAMNAIIEESSSDGKNHVGAQIGKSSSFVESSALDEESIPKELRRDAIDLPVRGAINGWCYLVPYKGKLKTHTIKKTVGMFVPLMRNGQEKMVSVSVVKEDRIIYISKDMFKLYEKGLSEPEGIELRKTFFD